MIQKLVLIRSFFQTTHVSVVEIAKISWDCHNHRICMVMYQRRGVIWLLFTTIMKADAAHQLFLHTMASLQRTRDPRKSHDISIASPRLQLPNLVWLLLAGSSKLLIQDMYLDLSFLYQGEGPAVSSGEMMKDTQCRMFPVAYASQIPRKLSHLLCHFGSLTVKWWSQKFRIRRETHKLFHPYWSWWMMLSDVPPFGEPIYRNLTSLWILLTGYKEFMIIRAEASDAFAYPNKRIRLKREIHLQLLVKTTNGSRFQIKASLPYFHRRTMSRALAAAWWNGWAFVEFHNAQHVVRRNFPCFEGDRTKAVLESLPSITQTLHLYD